MSLEIKGKVVKVLQEQSGEGKNGRWVKHEFVIETNDQYPKKACFSAWGDKAAEVKNLSVGEAIEVSFNIESREYNNRWYTDLRAWRIAKAGQQSENAPSNLPPISENDIPPADEGDDLPF